MKTKKHKGLNILVPETIEEAIDQLEEFLICDIEADDYSEKYIKKNFKICRKQIKEIQDEIWRLYD